MADKYQNELTALLGRSGFVAIKNTDYHINSYGKKVFPNQGIPDTFFAGRLNRGGFVECKTGVGKYRQAFPFKNWRDDQREWFANHDQAAYWLFIVLGKRIGAKKYPRIALLMPAWAFTAWEERAERKSIPYKEAETSIWRLEWKDGHWSVPEYHLFHVQYIGGAK